MKNLLWVGVLFLAACSKNADQQTSQTDQATEKQSCDFGIQQFNLTKRPSVAAEDQYANRIKGNVQLGATTTTTASTTTKA